MCSLSPNASESRMITGFADVLDPHIAVRTNLARLLQRARPAGRDTDACWTDR